jgi:Protein of unknown function (DUF3662)/Inner membrane component of T3SS, cytoplasmic domain
MGLFRRLENRVEKSFEGGFGKAFKSNVQPVELARKLAREMDDSKTISVSRVYAPNIYTVYLSPKDREQFATYEASLRTELAGYLAEHARRQGYTVPGKLRVLLETAAELKVGTFGIAVLLSEDPVLPEEPVAPPARGSRRVPRAPGQTAAAAAESDAAPAKSTAAAGGATAAPRPSVPPVPPVVAVPMPDPPGPAGPESLPPEFSDDPSVGAFPAADDSPADARPDAAAYDLEADDDAVQSSEPIVDEAAEPVAVAPPADLFEDEPVYEQPTTSWLLTWPGGSYVVDRRAIVIGRSRDCDVVLADGNVSRRHAELIRQSSMFLIRDLDSTNGVAVNGRRVREAAVAAGDVITIGATTITLERKR